MATQLLKTNATVRRNPLAIAVLLGLSSCAAETEPIQQTRTALQADGTAEFKDRSDTITVRVSQCGWEGPGSRPFTCCAVAPGFVLAGGGAEIEGEAPQPGALLVGSYPLWDKQQWCAESKDQNQQFVHRTRAYSIGLKLAGLTPAQLKAQMKVVKVDGPRGHQVQATADLGPGFALLSGGGRANWAVFGLMLTQSANPNTNNLVAQWHVEGTDNAVPEEGFATAYAIGIKNPVPGFGQIQWAKGITISDTGDGYRTMTQSEDILAVTGIGGLAFETVERHVRFLTDLIPFSDHPSDHSQQGVFVSTKDHSFAQRGQAGAQLVGLVCPAGLGCGPCVGSCGGQSPAGCFCDAACGDFGDCCPGKQATCGCTGTDCGPCVGFCGGKSAAGCYCDAVCGNFGDCCPGKAFACPG